MLIFLIGFMGAGKTTLGKVAAKSLGLTFIDLDERLTREEGLSIPEIFAAEGEGYFRKREREVLEGLRNLPQGHYVIATGGGLPCHGDNLAWMNTHGKTLYLKQPPEVLISRLLREAETRPMLSRLPEAERPEFIRALLEKREAWYSQASHILEGTSLSPPGLIKNLLRLIAEEG